MAINTNGSINLSSHLSIRGILYPGEVGDIFSSSITLSLSMSGLLEEDYTVQGSIALNLSMSGTMEASEGVYGDASLVIPALDVLGDGISNPFGDASLVVPALSIAALGYDSCLGDGNAIIPSLSVSASGSDSIIGNALLAIPMITLAVEASSWELGDASLLLPSLKLSGSILSGITGSLDTSIPRLRLSASGYLSTEGSGAVVIPMLSLNAAIIPSSFLSLVINIKNSALTEYSNYGFNSFCRFNGKHFGAASTGIFDLDDGDTDNSELIDWSFRVPYLDLEQNFKKQIKQLWFSYKSNGDLVVTVIQPDGEEFEYILEMVNETEGGLRVKVGKGIKSKYVTIDVRNTIGNFIVLDVLKLQFDKTNKLR